MLDYFEVQRSDLRPTSVPVKRLGVVLRPEREMSAVLDRVATWAAGSGVTLVGAGEDPRLPAGTDLRPGPDFAAGCDVVLALGGDGTVLGALRVAAGDGVPVLGVNLGTLGYLAEVDAAHLDQALTSLERGDYAVETRTALVLNPVAGTEVGAEVAYNDFVFSRVPGRGQAALSLRVDGELLVRYSSDGVIVATPIGSTAYSFAAGGPLVSPRAQGMIVTPDAPHGLFNRAVVLADHERLDVGVLASSAPVSVERDGQLLGQLDPGAAVELLALPDAARMVRVRPGGFAERARRKLGISDPAGLADYDLAGHER